MIKDLTPEEFQAMDDEADHWSHFYDNYHERNFISHTYVRRLVREKTDGHCFYCGKKFGRGRHNGFCVDHFYPWSKYRSNLTSFLFPACGECNMLKKDKTPSEWRKIFEEKHGTDWFWMEKVYTQINLTKMTYAHNHEYTGESVLIMSNIYRTEPFFDDDTICCGKVNDLVDFLNAIKEIYKGLRLKDGTYKFKDVVEALRDIYNYSKAAHPNKIPEILFNPNY